MVICVLGINIDINWYRYIQTCFGSSWCPVTEEYSIQLCSNKAGGKNIRYLDFLKVQYVYSLNFPIILHGLPPLEDLKMKKKDFKK